MAAWENCSHSCAYRSDTNVELASTLNERLMTDQNAVHICYCV